MTPPQNPYPPGQPSYPGPGQPQYPQTPGQGFPPPAPQTPGQGFPPPAQPQYMGQPPGYPQTPGQGFPQQPGYPQQPGFYPAAPGLSQQELQGAPRPKAVDISFLMWVANFVIGVLSTVIVFAAKDAIIEATMRSYGLDPNSEFGSEVAQRAREAAEPGAGNFLYLLLVVAWLAVAFLMRSGQNWARILLTVFGGLGLLLQLVGLGGLGVYFSIGGIGAFLGLLHIVQLITLIAGLALMYVGDANRYFASR